MKHTGLCDKCGSFDLEFGFDGYVCEKCGHEGDYTRGMNKVCYDCYYTSDGPTEEDTCPECGGNLWYPL